MVFFFMEINTHGIESVKNSQTKQIQVYQRHSPGTFDTPTEQLSQWREDVATNLWQRSIELPSIIK